MLFLWIDEPEVKPAYTRYYSQNKFKKLIEHLSSLDISNILLETDPNIATNKFLDTNQCLKYIFR